MMRHPNHVQRWMRCVGRERECQQLQLLVTPHVADAHQVVVLSDGVVEIVVRRPRTVVFCIKSVL